MKLRNLLIYFPLKLINYIKHSADKGIKAPAFNSIKTLLYKEINNNLPKDIADFDLIPDESIYYKIFDNNFLLFKNNRVVIF